MLRTTLNASYYENKASQDKLPANLSAALSVRYTASDAILGLPTEGILRCRNDGDVCSGILDSSGNKRHLRQLNASQRPLVRGNKLNGWPAIVFDGVDDFLVTEGNFITTFPSTTYLVANVLGVNEDFIDCRNSADLRSMFKAAGGGLVVAQGTAPFTGPTIPSAFAILCAVYDGASTVSQVNRAVSSGTTSNVEATGMSLGGAALGSNQEVGQGHCPIEICEVLHFSKGHSLTEREAVFTYLNQKYKLLP